MNQVTPHAMPRIVSLIPSATEIVAGLGYAAGLVGRSHECDEPTEVRSLPACTGPTIDASADSGEIHRQIQQQLQQQSEAFQALSIYEVDHGLLDALAPDVIITQSQCSICAVSEDAVRDAVADMVTTAPTVVTCEPRQLADVWADMQRIAQALGDAPAGERLVSQCQQRMQAIEQRARQGTEPPRMAILEWLEPLMGCGNWLPELVQMAGGVSVFGQPGAHAQWLDFEALEQTAVDRLVALPCGFDLGRAEAELERLLYEPRWAGLEPVQQGQLYAADGHHFFNRPGPRLVESLAILAEVAHPELFSPDHKGHAWRQPAGYTTAEANP
jgi:iron complex transport system substrate-binding protein